MAFLSSGGYTNDIQTFASWAMTLDQRGLGGFYAGTSFIDYPPGYLYVLALVGKIYAPFAHADVGWGLLYKLIKIPAILADLVNAALVATLARRISPRAGVVACVCALFLPPIVAISAAWGQVDSVAACAMLAAVVCLDGALRAAAVSRRLIVGAWVALAVSILIKPASLVLAPIFLAAIFVRADGGERRAFAGATALGAATALLVVYALSAPFAPDPAPLATLRWLLERYLFGSNVYAYNSVNAFNLYAIAQPMWQSDSIRTPFFGLPQNIWGAGLVVAAIVGIAARFAQLRRPGAFLEACMLAELAFFSFATRMHERYIFSALILCVPLVARARAYVVALGVIAFSLACNLYYSLYYLDVVTRRLPGDPHDLVPWMSRGCGFLVVATLFFLGFRYFGLLGEERAPTNVAASDAEAARPLAFARSARPSEGLAPLAPRDHLLGLGFALASFVLCFWNYRYPTEKVFDEIYYARSGAEYLKHIEQYEWTHPPFTKLVITASMWLFGGVPVGDTSAGWRFLNVAIGALMTGLLFRFVKRVSGSTLAAALAAGFLLFDGFHFVQSRIATPEITVAFLTLALLTCFYEYWIASQIRRVPYGALDRRGYATYAICGLAGAGAGAALAQSLVAPDFAKIGGDAVRHTEAIVAYALPICYCLLGGLLAAHAILARRSDAVRAIAYPDGSLVLPRDAARPVVVAAEAPAGVTRTIDGASMTFRATDDREGVGVRCDPDGTLTATSIEGGWTARLDVRRAPRLLAAVAVAAGLLAASKWNGLFTLALVLAVICAVGLGRRATWGNPRGMTPVLAVGVVIFATVTIYAASYIPYFRLVNPNNGTHHTLTDAVDLQRSMYAYHHDLKATHPYQSSWWEWPLLVRPISYYYKDYRAGAARDDAHACCVAEILALPNPIVWWGGLVSVPLLGVFAWLERRKGYALVVAAYFAQWIPWIASPRIAFEYHFFPNLALICAADAILLARLLAWARARDAREGGSSRFAARAGVAFVCACVVGAFVFYYPLLAATRIPYDQWQARIPSAMPFLRWI